MPSYFYLVTVDSETKEQADEVIGSRIGHDEDYGFDYTIDWSVTPWMVLENEE